MKNMVTIFKTENVEVLVQLGHLLQDKEVFVLRCNNIFYSPYLNYKPIEGGQRLYQRYIQEYEQNFEQIRQAFQKLAGQVAKNEQKEEKGGVSEQIIELLNEQKEQLAQLKAAQAKSEQKEGIKNITLVKSEQGEKVFTKVLHKKFQEVLEDLSVDIPCYLVGPAGSGKNVLAKDIADALHLDFYFTNSVTQEYKLTGFIDANGHFHETEFYKAFTNGGLFLLDELDASIPETLNILNAAIANRYFTFPNGYKVAHKDFRVIAAGNTYGRGASALYTGRAVIDGATSNRFVNVLIEYDEKIELDCANNDEELVQFIHDFRNACDAAAIDCITSYRNIEYIAKMQTFNRPLAGILESALVKGLEKDDINTIISNGFSDNRYYQALLTLKENKK